MKPSCFSTKIDLSFKNKLLNDLKEQGFEFSQPMHTIFAAKKQGIVCVLYKSGALTVQGKEKDQFIEFYLEPEILKDFSYSYPHEHVDLTSRIGVDEAGKGDFFGPLSVAGVYAEKDQIKKLINLHIKDSKKISDSNILKLSTKIKDLCPFYSILRLFPQKYNELYAKFKNLNLLLAWGHTTVIANLLEKTKCKKAIIDQFAKKSVIEDAISRKKINIEVEQRTHAEEDVVVAAASIIARAGFLTGLDRISEKLSIQLPKGASSKVIEIGKRIVNKHGEEILFEISKIHFKTKDDILT